MLEDGRKFQGQGEINYHCDGWKVGQKLEVDDPKEEVYDRKGRRQKVTAVIDRIERPTDPDQHKVYLTFPSDPRVTQEWPGWVIKRYRESS